MGFAAAEDGREADHMPRDSPSRRGEDLDLYDYENILRSRLPTTPPWRVSVKVTDDWPRDVPIGWREIQVTETHLEKALAELLGPLP
jgi:hypothetical protein